MVALVHIGFRGADRLRLLMVAAGGPSSDADRDVVATRRCS